MGLGSVGKWVGISTLIGLAGGLAAVVFHWLTEVISANTLRRAAGFAGEGLSTIDSRAWLVVAIPALGGLVVGLLIQGLAPEAEGHGTEQMIRVFHNLNGRVRKRIIALKALTSAITIGTGGSAGQEGPVAQMGSGIGSTIATSLKLSDRERRIFLLSGSSAGIGALFTAPLGGALFAPEVLYRKAEFEGEAIIPCIISSIVAFATYTSISGHSRAVEIDAGVLESLAFRDARLLLLYVALALLCVPASWLYVRAFNKIGDLFRSIPKVPAAVRPALGGASLGLLALALSPLAGEQGVLFGGYELMRASIDGTLAVHVLLVLAVAKIVATSLSIASGGSGGVFAPSLAIGATLGAAVGQTADALLPGLGIHPASFALVGMGGFFAGVAKTPIAAIIIVSEMTGGYELLAPLMLVSVVHMMLAPRWSIYETQVNGLVDSPAHMGEFVVDVLEQMKVHEVPETVARLHTVSENATLRKALDLVSTTTGNYYPVLDANEKLVGVFSMSDIRRIFLETGIEDLVIVRDFMVDRVVTVTPDDDLNTALSRMNEISITEIPVVDSEDPGKVIGMLTRNQLGAVYHKRLRELRRAAS